MTAIARTAPRPPSPYGARVPVAGIPAEPVAANLLRHLIDALATASEIQPHGNGFALIVPLEPGLIDLIAIAGAGTEDVEDDDPVSTRDTPDSGAGDPGDAEEADEGEDAGDAEPMLGWPNDQVVSYGTAAVGVSSQAKLHYDGRVRLDDAEDDDPRELDVDEDDHRRNLILGDDGQWHRPPVYAGGGIR